MSFDSTYDTLRERCESLAPDAVLETPTTNRVLTVLGTDENQVRVRPLDTESSRTLDRGRFRSLYERIESSSEGLTLANVPPGAEPYVAVLSLLPDVRVTDDEVVSESGADETDSPLLAPAWDERTAPQRLHDDATLLVDLLDRYEVATASVEGLADLYVLLSDVQYEAGDLREDVRDRLLAAGGTRDRVHGRFGAVARTERRRRHVKDDQTVLRQLDDLGIPREWVLGIDRQKLDVVVAATDLKEDDVYDVETQTYLRKTDVENLEKEAHLRGLGERVRSLDGDHARRLHEEVEALEQRLDSLLAD